MPLHRLEHHAADRIHEVLFDHNPLTDRGTLRIDGVLVPAKLVRKPFGSLFRYRFALGAELLEVRLSPSSLHGYDVILAPAEAPLASKGIALRTILSVTGFGGAMGAAIMALAGVVPLGASVAINAVAASVASGIMWLVYGRGR
ncbi:MAG: hypothetical protein WKG00_15500 [Polyangiaceae bacterium]